MEGLVPYSHSEPCVSLENALQIAYARAPKA